MKTQFKVEGMMCKGCTSRVEKKLAELGCTEVCADHVAKLVSCELNHNTEEQIALAIEKLGFTVTR